MALGGQLDVIGLGDKGFKLHAMIPFGAPVGPVNEQKDNSNPYCGRPCRRSRRLPFAPGKARRANRSSVKPAMPRRPISATRIRGRMLLSWIFRCPAVVASMQSSISAGWMFTRASSCSQCTAGLLMPYRPFVLGPKGTSPKAAPRPSRKSCARYRGRPASHLS